MAKELFYSEKNKQIKQTFRAEIINASDVCEQPSFSFIPKTKITYISFMLEPIAEQFNNWLEVQIQDFTKPVLINMNDLRYAIKVPDGDMQKLYDCLMTKKEIPYVQRIQKVDNNCSCIIC